jgi:hypothetical protein
MMLTPEEIKNLLVCLAKTPLVGAEALTIALLQQKLSAMLTVPVPPPAPAPPPKEPTDAPQA